MHKRGTAYVLQIFAAVSAALCSGRAHAQNIFDVAGVLPEHVYVMFEDRQEAIEGPQSAMTLRVRGVAADVPPAKIRELRACVSASKAPSDLAKATRLCVIEAVGKTDTRAIEILRTPSAVLCARAMSAEAGKPESAKLGRHTGKTERVVVLSAERFLKLSSGWDLFAPNAETVIPKPGTTLEMTRPYVAGEVAFDRELVGERIFRGHRSQLEPMTRDLGDTSIWVRVPKGYSVTNVYGALVWVSPMLNGKPPEELWAACDELGLVCVGADGAGNDVQFGDRCQRVFDSLATASLRFHLDRRRVYITGMSGGGKISSLLWACFPDVFAGSVPIVGLACYENVPVGDGKMWPAIFNRPAPEYFNMAQQQRCAAITGVKDFNYEPIQRSSRVLTRDGMNVRVFDEPAMGHEMPTPEQFLEAMRWVDEPARARLDQQRKQGEAMLGAVKTGIAKARTAKGAKPELDAAQRASLVGVTETAPWTECAWEATRLLEIVPVAPFDAAYENRSK